MVIGNSTWTAGYEDGKLLSIHAIKQKDAHIVELMKTIAMWEKRFAEISAERDHYKLQAFKLEENLTKVIAKSKRKKPK